MTVLICRDWGWLGGSGGRLAERFGLQPFADFRERGAGGYFASSYQGGAVFEGVVFEAVDVGFNHHVRGYFPLAAVHLLGYRKTLSDYIE